VPLGGLGEIGMNCLVLESANDLVLIDCGIQFPDSSYAGVDLLLPDLNYVRERHEKVRGVVVTHGHDDHIGAIPYLLKDMPLDVYCTPFPQGLLEQKLTEVSGLNNVNFQSIEEGKSFELGCFRFHPIRVQHSIIESLAFAIESPAGTLIHTGDFKHDPMEVGGEVIGFEKFEEWGRKGVQLLLSDSTNAERMGHTISECEIEKSFQGILSKQNCRIIIALFASNIRRIENILRLASKLGKKVALAGRSMHSYTKLAHDQSSLDIPADTLIRLENTQQYPDKDVIILATGSQAEPQSALVRIAQGQHKEMQIKPGDLVMMSSRFIPGNERNITAMIDQLYRAGAEVLYEAIHQIHVSGHGFQDELLLMLKATRPKFFVPLHGEYRHLKKHASLAKASGVRPENISVIEDGQILELTRDSLSLAERLELQKTAIVETERMDGNQLALQQRLSLSRTGIVFAVLIRDRDTLRLVARPQVAFHGLLLRHGLNLDTVRQDAIDAVRDIHDAAPSRNDLLDYLKLEIRRFFKKRASHKPVVIPMVLEM